MSEFPKTDSVVSFADMRRELLLRNRLSPIVAARARLSELREKAGPADKVIIPFYQAATVMLYLDHNRDIPNYREARNELEDAIKEAMVSVKYNDKPIPLFVAISEKTFETFALLDGLTIIESMAGKFAAELEHTGHELI